MLVSLLLASYSMQRFICQPVFEHFKKIPIASRQWVDSKNVVMFIR
jgi:hypothetical protein